MPHVESRAGQDHRISVIIPAYNAVRFIGNAIQSVFDQTYSASEIIVVDDGSTDGLETVVRSFVPHVPITYYRQDNQGAGAARNFAASKARHDWIAFLDADDCWDRHKLAVQVAYLQDHPEAQFVYSDVIERDTDDALISPRDLRYRSVEPLVFGDRPFALPSTVLMRNNLLRAVGGFSSRLRIYEDIELYARIQRVTPLHYIPLHLATYRLHPSQSTMNPALQETYWPILLEMFWNLWPSDPPKRAVVGKYLAKLYADRCKHCLITAEYKQAQQAARLALRHNGSIKNFRRLIIASLPGMRWLWYAFRNVPSRNYSPRTHDLPLRPGHDQR